MPKYDFEKQQEIGSAFYEVIKEKDAEPQDILLASMRFAFITLRELINADENGNKKERMQQVWNDCFIGMCEDTGTK